MTQFLRQFWKLSPLTPALRPTIQAVSTAIGAARQRRGSYREAGLIVAEARSRAAGFVGSDAPPDVHRLNVEVTPLSSDPPRTRVTARGTPFTGAFLERLEETLKTRFVP